MTDIKIDPTKSWNEIQWIYRSNDYLAYLITIATRVIPDLQNLRDSIINNNWTDAYTYLTVAETKLVDFGLFTKMDLMQRSMELISSRFSNSHSDQAVANLVMVYIELLERSLCLSGKQLKFDVSKLASLIGHKNHKKQIVNLFLFNSVFYPNYNAICYQSTLSQMSQKNKDLALIAVNNFCGLVGYKMNLRSDFFSEKSLKHEQTYKTKFPVFPENFASISRANDTPLAKHVLKKCVPGKSVAQIAKECGIPCKNVESILSQINVSCVDESKLSKVSDLQLNNTSETKITAKSMPPPLPIVVPNSPPQLIVDNWDGYAFKSMRIGRKARIAFHRTLRVPEDGKDYPLPASLGTLPIHRVEDFAETVPPKWLEEGGFFVPLYQKEALFIEFSGEDWSPSIAKVCVGGINAITGKSYSENLTPHSQDYVVIPQQKWLDGINSGDGTVSQFVAMPLGLGYTVEAQITDEEKQGGFQLLLFESKDGKFEKPDLSMPCKVDFIKRIAISEFEKIRKTYTRRENAIITHILNGDLAAKAAFLVGMETYQVIDIFNIKYFQLVEIVKTKTIHYFGNDSNAESIINLVLRELKNIRIHIISAPKQQDHPSADEERSKMQALRSSPSSGAPSDFSLKCSPTRVENHINKEMGIAAGGKIKQQIFRDPYGVDSWDYNKKRLLKIHIVNSDVYKEITGNDPPPSPVTQSQYVELGIPWFSHYDEHAQHVKASHMLHKISGVDSIDRARGLSESKSEKSIVVDDSLIKKIKTPDLNEAIEMISLQLSGLINAGSWGSAVKKINNILDIKTIPDSQDYALRSLCNFYLKNYIEGMFDADNALAINRSNVDGLYYRSKCRMALGDFDGCLEDANAIETFSSDKSLGFELRAELFFAMKDFEKSMNEAQVALMINPENKEAESLLELLTSIKS